MYVSFLYREPKVPEAYLELLEELDLRYGIYVMRSEIDSYPSVTAGYKGSRRFFRRTGRSSTYNSCIFLQLP